MRSDWDPGRWKDDLRRRAVEALIADGDSAAEPLILRFADQRDTSLDDLVAVRDDDRVFTALACVEVIAVLESHQPGCGTGLYEQSMATARSHLGADELGTHAKKGQFAQRATRLLEQLMNDTDAIIPLTVFDQVEMWTSDRGRLAASLADLAIRRGSPEDPIEKDLAQRAHRARSRLEAASSG